MTTATAQGFMACTSSVGVGLLERLRGARDRYATEEDAPTRQQRLLITKQEEEDEDEETSSEATAAAPPEARPPARDHYLAALRQFFAHESAHERLLRFYDHALGAAIFPVVAHFVVRHGKTRTFHCERFDGTLGTYCPADEYSSALRKFTKRYYDFVARSSGGDGDDDDVAPVAAFEGHARTVHAPIAQLNALGWFIELGFDRHFWAQADEMAAAHRVLHAATKRQYSESHKKRRRALREAAERDVVRMRSHRSARPSDGTAARLTHEERKRISELVAVRKRQQKALARAERKRVKRRKTKEPSPKLAERVLQVSKVPKISM